MYISKDLVMGRVTISFQANMMQQYKYTSPGSLRHSLMEAFHSH